MSDYLKIGLKTSNGMPHLYDIETGKLLGGIRKETITNEVNSALMAEVEFYLHDKDGNKVACRPLEDEIIDKTSIHKDSIYKVDSLDGVNELVICLSAYIPNEARLKMRNELTDAYPDKTFLILDPDMRLEQLDEDVMKRAGWVRA